MNMQWRKTTYSSGNEGNCIEVATGNRSIVIRDSKDPDGPRLENMTSVRGQGKVLR